MTPLVAIVALLVVFGSLLAIAESSLTRMTRARAMTLREEGRRNAELVERIEKDPFRYLNSVYLSVMLAQNGSAILVAIIADRTFGELGITLLSVGFTLFYFVLVEAMAKSYGVLQSDRAALLVAPLVVGLAKIFSWPVRLLIGLANVLLPGRGLKEGPFVSAAEIRRMADVGHESGGIAEDEKQLIHSIFELGDTIARDVMVPRPDMVVVDSSQSLQDAMELAVRQGFSRIPVYDGERDNIVGVVYAKDLLSALRDSGERDSTLRGIARDPYFVPETKPASELLREMQRKHVHLAIVVDEYGDVAGLVTLEDLLEEIVGEITDEFDVQEAGPIAVGEDTWRVQAKMPVREFNELVGCGLPEHEDWQTLGGFVSSRLAKIPEAGDEVDYEGFKFRVERVQRRRIGAVLVTRSTTYTRH